MKHYILLAFVSFVCLTSCNSDSKLKALIESNINECPLEITKQFTLVSVVDNGTDLVYRYEYADSLYDPAANQKQYGDQAMKEVSLRALRDTPASRELFDAVAEAGRGMRYEYIGVPSGDSCALVITPADIQAAKQ